MKPVSRGQRCIKQEIKKHINHNRTTHRNQKQNRTTNKETATTTKYNIRKQNNNNNNPSLLLQRKKQGLSSILLWTKFAVQFVTAPLPTVLSSAETHTTLRDPSFCSTLDCKIKSGFSPLKTLFCVCTI